MTHKRAFENFVKANGIVVLDSIPNTDIKKGDMVMFTNDSGITFGPREVFGFVADKSKHENGRCVYWDTDAYWLPCRLDQIRLAD